MARQDLQALVHECELSMVVLRQVTLKAQLALLEGRDANQSAVFVKLREMAECLMNLTDRLDAMGAFPSQPVKANSNDLKALQDKLRQLAGDKAILPADDEKEDSE